MNQNLEQLEKKLARRFHEILESPLAAKIQKVLSGGDKKLYVMWLTQIAHITRHTSAHQALVGIRVLEKSFPYAQFCFEHASEEVGHEMMAIHDLKRLGVAVESVADLPAPLISTEKAIAYLYHISERANPLSRLGYSYWAEKCYPYVQQLADSTKDSLGLQNTQMTFFVSHAVIDEKHAKDVERILSIVCKTDEDWMVVEKAMIT